MSLETAKIENLRHGTDGEKIGRCPACAKHGRDTKGEHLIIYPDGRFGCVAHQKDRAHNKRIWQLVGDRGKRGEGVRQDRQ